LAPIPALNALREQYAMPANVLRDGADRQALAAFFFWSAWSAATDRPGENQLSYTSNWPHEPLVGNTPTAGTGIWSIASVILMLGAIAAMIFFHSTGHEAGDPTPPRADPLFNMKVTPSMLATRKYFYVVIALILAQVGMGVITAHYAVEGTSFFGIPLGEILPFTVSRTIHTQFAVLWIATAWLATGLYIAPAISGSEPKFQSLGVNVLFYALLLIVAGSTVTGWLGTLQNLGNDYSFWIGNQGLEYTSMGRVWQILLFVGLLIWVGLLGRALLPALRTPSESRGLIAMVFLAAMCIGGFYATSLAWGQQTHYAMIEYWRWWLVHLWVEGFFEVFATAVIALLFTRLGLIRAATANSAIILETIVFMFGGILGTLHHLYFTGTPTSVIAIGAMFSALEVVPLAMIGVEAWRNYQRSQGGALGAGVQVADSVLHRRWLLERRRRRPPRLHAQYADRPVLHAGNEHDRRARSCGSVRRLWNARHRSAAVLPARSFEPCGVVRQVARPDFLVAQYRSGDDGLHVARAGRCLPGVGQHQRGCMVCTFAGFRAFVVDGNLRLVARPGRHRLCSRYAVPGALRWALADRPA
jgi:nitric oxide reductase subunit B